MPLKDHEKINQDEIKNVLEEHFGKITKDPRVNSAVMGVETLDKDFEWVGVHGPADLNAEPIRPDTPVWIASVTKLYIASTILKLSEKGLVDIDAPMAAYLPADLIQGIHHTSDGVDHTDKITIRNLLSHSSGLADYLEESPEDEEGLMDQVFDGNDREFSIIEAMNLLRTHLPAHFPPQQHNGNKKKIRYSDTNYQLLIEIIKKIKEQSFHDVLTEIIYGPLGLESTFHPGTRFGNSSKEAAVVWSGDQPLNTPKAMRSFGDLNSTVRDMIKFMRGLINGNFFDHPETWQMMQRDFASFGFSLDPSPKSPPWPVEYGLGIMRLEMPRLFTLFNPIPAAIGHTGVSGSWLFYCSEYNLILSGTVNQVAAAALPFRFLPMLLSDRRLKVLSQGI